MNLKSKLPTKLQKYASFGVIPKLLLAPVAFLILLGFSLARPFVHIRLYRMMDSRIGHLATNTEIVRLNQLRHNLGNTRKEITVYCSESRHCANKFLRKLFFHKTLHLRGSLAWITLSLARNIRIFRTHSTIANKNLPIDREGLILEKRFMALRISRQDSLVGENFLSSLSTSEEKTVCLNVRDDKYLATYQGNASKYHAYRDSEISTYIAAAEALAEMGYTVFRMGAIVKEPLISKHPRVIDYATNGMRTEFLDVYLGAKCKFCVSTGTGWDSIPQIFRRPSMYVNLLPILALSCIVRDLIIYPKILKDEISQENLNLFDIFDSELGKLGVLDDYSMSGVAFRDLSSDELVEAVTEMAQRVEGTFVETPEQKEMQAKLKRILSTHPQLQPSPNYYPIRAQFASSFLSRYPNFLDGLE
jgi:putative glycosyltransferase (TIGR04372 family)